MDDNEIIARMVELEQKVKSQGIRLDHIERSTEALTEMASSIKLLAYKQDESNAKIDTLSAKVSALEIEPANRWKAVIGYILAALCSGGIGALITLLAK